MKRTLGQKMLGHGSVYALSRLFNTAVGFALIPLYAHLIGDEGYGVISLMFAVGTAVGFVIQQGQLGSWYRLRFDQPDGRQLKIFESTLIWYLMGSIVVGVALLSLVGPSLARLATPGIAYYPLGLLTVIGATLLVFPNLYQRKLQAEQRPLAFAVFTAFKSLVIPGTIIILVAGFRRGVLGKIEADVVSGAVLSAVALILIRPGSPRLVSRTKLRRSLAYGLPLVPHNLAALTNNLINRMLVNCYLGLGATGVFSMGYKIAGIGTLLATAINQALSPLFYSTMQQIEQDRGSGRQDAIEVGLRSLARAALLMLVTVTCCLICITAGARELLLLLTTEQFNRSWTVVALVCAGALAITCYYPLSMAIMYNPRRVRLMPIISITAALVNISANVVLIPRLGFIGAAWATLISNTVLALIALPLGQRSTYVPHYWGKWAAVLTLTLGTLAGLWMLDNYIDGLGLRVALKLALAVAAIGMIMVTTKVKPADIMKLFRQKKT